MVCLPTCGAGGGGGLHSRKLPPLRGEKNKRPTRSGPGRKEAISKDATSSGVIDGFQIADSLSDDLLPIDKSYSLYYVPFSAAWKPHCLPCGPLSPFPSGGMDGMEIYECVVAHE